MFASQLRVVSMVAGGSSLKRLVLRVRTVEERGVWLGRVELCIAMMAQAERGATSWAGCSFVYFPWSSGFRLR